METVEAVEVEDVTEVKLLVAEAQCEEFFATLERDHVNVFPMKTPVEYGGVGARPRLENTTRSAEFSTPFDHRACV